MKQMKGKVFIGWSGKDAIAQEVKSRLEQAEYEGVVGGDTKKTKTLFLGQSILNEIDSCDQAIFILQKKDNGNISSNTLFEFGYALSRFRANKIHAFFIGIPHKDESIPSDIRGIWAESLPTAGDGELAGRVVESFLRDQKNVINENKMEIISSYYEKRHAFYMFDNRPFCSEYELAQHVLFFSQAAYIMNDIHEASACLKQLALSLKETDDELEQALQFGQHYLDIFLNISTDEGRLSLKNRYFIDAKNAFEGILKNVTEWPEENEFKTWFELLLYDMLNYVYVLRAACPGTPPEKCDAYLLNSLPFADECLKRCAALAGNDGDAQCVGLYRAYMYRNLATAYQKCSKPNEEESIRYLKLSFEERKKLLDYYKIRSISSRIFESFEMEYYIAVSELLDYPEDEDVLDEYIESCSSYLERIKQLHKEKTHFIRRIERKLMDVGEKWQENT